MSVNEFTYVGTNKERKLYFKNRASSENIFVCRK